MKTPQRCSKGLELYNEYVIARDANLNFGKPDYNGKQRAQNKSIKALDRLMKHNRNCRRCKAYLEVKEFPP